MNKLLLMCLLVSCGTVSAALNKWVDAQGNVHYSDKKPPHNVKSKTLRSTSVSDKVNTDEIEKNSSNASTSTSNEFQSIAERQAERKRAKLKKQEANTKRVKEKADAEYISDYCESARDNLKSLKDGIRLAELDENGDRSYISDEKRQASIVKIQNNIKEFCN